MMKSEIAKYLLCISIGFLLCLTLVSPKKETKILKGEVTTITKTDTVYTPRPYPEVKTITKVVKVPYVVEKLDTVYMVSSKNHYRDTLKVENNFHLTYDATTIGQLDKITVGYVDNRPTKVIKETNTIVKQPAGLYIGGQTDLKFNTSVGALFIKDRNIIGASMKLNQDSFSNPTKYNVSYYRRLF